MIDIQTILGRLPHRYPFLLVDRVLQIERGESIRALKNVTINEPFFPGHFPGRPVMPGVLIIESLAQAGGLLALETAGEEVGNRLLLFRGIERAKFRKPVVPGDQLLLHVRVIKRKQGFWTFAAEAHVEGTMVAEAELSAAIVGVDDV